MITDYIKMRGDVNIIKTSGNGEVEEFNYRNLVVESGKLWIARAMVHGLNYTTDPNFKTYELNQMQIGNSSALESGKTAIAMTKLNGATTYVHDQNGDGRSGAGNSFTKVISQQGVAGSFITTITFTAKFSNCPSLFSVKEAGIFAANDSKIATTNYMLCRTTFNEINIEPADSISITWVITIE